MTWSWLNGLRWSVFHQPNIRTHCTGHSHSSFNPIKFIHSWLLVHFGQYGTVCDRSADVMQLRSEPTVSCERVFHRINNECWFTRSKRTRTIIQSRRVHYTGETIRGFLALPSPCRDLYRYVFFFPSLLSAVRISLNFSPGSSSRLVSALEKLQTPATEVCTRQEHKRPRQVAVMYVGPREKESAVTDWTPGSRVCVLTS